MADAPLTADSPPAFTSLDALREAHTALLERRRAEDPPSAAFLEAARAFVLRGAATGALLDDDGDRRVAQSLLDFWANLLYRADRTELDATLAEFDPALAPRIPDAHCPFVGLEAFDEGNSALFFGRQRLVAELITRLGEQRLVAVVGPSGSGKSSVVRAGLIPALRAGALPGSGSWRFLGPIVPGSDPLGALARVLPHEALDTETPLLLAIDQFEEIYTLCDSEAIRAAFIAQIVALASRADRQDRVVLTMRSDFEPFVVRAQELQSLWEAGRVQVTPLIAGELREAIERPAQEVGLRFEPGVIDALLHDILGEPAALPLLQFTLLELWKRRDYNRVTMAAYRETGGGRTALANSADALYGDLIEEEKTTARRIFLRMVRPTEGLEVTSSRVRRSDLLRIGEDPGRVERVLDKLTRARLLRVTDGDAPDDAQVEVAHEALVRNWPTLAQWLEEERDVLRRRRRLTVAATQWEALGRDPGALLRGAALEEAERYDDVSELEHIFVSTSRAEVTREAREREEARQREIELIRAQADAERLRAEEQAHASKRLRRLVAALAVMTVLMLLATAVAGTLALRAQQSAHEATVERNEAQAARAEAEQARADSDRLRGEAERSAARAAELEQRARVEERRSRAAQIATVAATTGGSGAFLLAAEALSITLAYDEPMPPAAYSMFTNPYYTVAGRTLASVGGYWESTSLLSPDGRWLLVSDTTVDPPSVVLWDLGAPEPRVMATLAREPLVATQFSPDGTYLAIATQAGAIQIWNLSGAAPRHPPHTINARIADTSPDQLTRRTASLAISAGGRRVIAALADGTVRTWDIGPGEPGARDMPLPPSDQPWSGSVEISADGRYGALASTSGSILVWTIGDEGQPRELAAPDISSDDRRQVSVIRLSPDGNMLIAGWSSGDARLWRLDQPPEQALSLELPKGESPFQRFWPSSAIFSQDSQRVAVCFNNTQVSLFDLRSPAPGQPFKQGEGCTDAWAFTPDARWLIASSYGELVRLDARRESGATSAYTIDVVSYDGVSVALNNDGRAGFSVSDDGNVRTWPVDGIAISPGRAELSDGQEPLLRPLVAAFTADSKRLMLAGGRGEGEWHEAGGAVQLWDIAAPEDGPTELPGHAQTVSAVAASPDGRWLATGGTDGVILLRDLTDPQREPFALRGPQPAVLTLRFSPDSAWLLALGGSLRSDRPDLTSDPAPRLWSLRDGRPAQEPIQLAFDGQPTAAGFFSPDGRRLAIGGLDNTVRVWDLPASAPAAPAQILSAPGATSVTAFSPDGRWLAATGSPGGVVFDPDLTRPTAAYVWDLTAGAQGAIPTTLSGHRGYVSALVFLPDGRLASAGADSTVRIWDIANATSPLLTLKAPSSIWSLAVSPDGRRLAAGLYNGNAALWDLSGVPDTFEPSEVYIEANSPATVTFSPDGQTLAVVLSARAATLLRVTPADLIAENCRLVGHNLHLDDWQRIAAGAPYRRTCPQYPDHPSTATPLVEQAQALAAAGEVTRATETYSQALALRRGLGIVPAEEARRTYAQMLVREAEQLAAADDVSGAAAALQRALTTYPDVRLPDAVANGFTDSEAMARRLAAHVWLAKLESFLAEGLVDEALDAYTRVRDRDPQLPVAVGLEINLCWRGSLQGGASTVMPVCDRAAAQDTSGVADATRGVARALVGDQPGAIEDLRAFVAWRRSNPNVPLSPWMGRVEEWLAALEAGHNPFDEATLNELRAEP